MDKPDGLCAQSTRIINNAHLENIIIATSAIKSVNLTLNDALVKEAKVLEINMSL